MAKEIGKLPKAIEKPLWDALAVPDPEAPVVNAKNGGPEPDPDLRDNENVPLPAVDAAWTPDPSDRLASLEYRSAVDDYVATEVLQYVPDAWIDHTKTKVGYEIPFTRHFFKYIAPRPLAEIAAEINALQAEIDVLLREVME
jgi:type I restriction enzyme M protein